MGCHSCFFICGRSVSGLSAGFVARMNSDVNGALCLQTEKMYSGLPNQRVKNSVF